MNSCYYDNYKTRLSMTKYRALQNKYQKKEVSMTSFEAQWGEVVTPKTPRGYATEWSQHTYLKKINKIMQFRNRPIRQFANFQGRCTGGLASSQTQIFLHLISLWNSIFYGFKKKVFIPPSLKGSHDLDFHLTRYP